MNPLFDAEQSHAVMAPALFFQTWKMGVEVAGIRFFGHGDHETFRAAWSLALLRPALTQIREEFDTLNSGKKIFLATMVSFYDRDAGQELLTRAGVCSLPDLSYLDLKRRRIIAMLLLNYIA